MDKKVIDAMGTILAKHAAAGEVGLPPEALQQLHQEQAAPMPGADTPQQPTPEQAVPPQDPQQPEGEPAIEAVIVAGLVQAFCSEIVSWYQYVYAKTNAHGHARNTFIQQCDEHAKDELEHAEILAKQLRNLVLQGGVGPVSLVPFSLSEVVGLNPGPQIQEEQDNTLIEVLNPQIIAAEASAVELYTTLAELTANSPYADINDAINGILASERDHVTDMQEIAFTIGVQQGATKPQA